MVQDPDKEKYQTGEPRHPDLIAGDVIISPDTRRPARLPLAHFLAEDALLADTHDGAPRSAEHGGPVRAMIPRLYAWKSAKWVRAIELLPADRPGYWERAGYHNRGNPWAEERFGE